MTFASLYLPAPIRFKMVELGHYVPKACTTGCTRTILMKLSLMNNENVYGCITRTDRQIFHQPTHRCVGLAQAHPCCPTPHPICLLSPIIFFYLANASSRYVLQAGLLQSYYPAHAQHGVKWSSLVWICIYICVWTKEMFERLFCFVNLQL